MMIGIYAITNLANNKKYYVQGIYNDENLETFVKAGMLTHEQANEIKASK